MKHDEIIERVFKRMKKPYRFWNLGELRQAMQLTLDLERSRMQATLKKWYIKGARRCFELHFEVLISLLFPKSLRSVR